MKDVELVMEILKNWPKHPVRMTSGDKQKLHDRIGAPPSGFGNPDSATWVEALSGGFEQWALGCAHLPLDIVLPGDTLPRLPDDLFTWSGKPGKASSSLSLDLDFLQVVLEDELLKVSTGGRPLLDEVVSATYRARGDLGDAWLVQLGALARLTQNPESAEAMTEYQRAHADLQNKTKWIQGQVRLLDKTLREAATPPDLSDKTGQRVWTKPYCPSCGAEGLTWITHSNFAKKDGAPGRETVGKRVRNGAYWSDADKRVPWCNDCGVRTPEGSGDVLPVSKTESAKSRAVFELPAHDRDMFINWTWGFVRSKHKLPADLTDDPKNAKEERGQEMFNVAIEAVLTQATERNGELNRDEVEEIAQEAMKQQANAETRSRKMSAGTLEHRTRADKPEPKSGRVDRKHYDPEDDPADRGPETW